MDEIRKKYWELVTNNIINSIDNIADYNNIELRLIKLNIMYNLKIMLESEEKFNDIISELQKNNEKRL